MILSEPLTLVAEFEFKTCTMYIKMHTSKNLYHSRLEKLTGLLQKARIFWDVTLLLGNKFSF